MEKEKEKVALLKKQELHKEKERQREEKRHLLNMEVLKKKQEKQLKLQKLHKVKLLLKEARKKVDMQRRRQAMELKQLLKQQREEKKIKNRLINNSLVVHPHIPKRVEQPLPPYPVLQVGVAATYIPTLLFVTEFLNSFKDLLNIHQSINIGKLIH